MKKSAFFGTIAAATFAAGFAAAGTLEDVKLLAHLNVALQLV